VEAVADRLDALARFLRAVDGQVPDQRLAAAHTVVEHAGRRLELSRDHSVVALAGATGSGKSSVFNAIAGMDLSQVGVRRPTTGVAHACVWGTDRAGPLLDWLGVPPSKRFARESALDGDDEAPMRGLVLLDLPDFDSVEEAHRIEVDRLLTMVDLIVWILDPQKYADDMVHRQYLRRFRQHQDITVVVLNQADRLGTADTERCLVDLRRLLVADGLDRVTVLASSVVGAPGLDGLKTLLERTVAARQAALRRLAGDLDVVVADLAPLVDRPAAEDVVDRNTVRALADALAAAAGVPAVVEATGRAYAHRAARSMGWPVLRWLRRLRPDPLRRLHLPERARDAAAPIAAAPIAAPTLPVTTPAERATVGLAIRTVADRAGEALPPPWPAAVREAARSRLDDVPDALDVAIASTDLGVGRPPVWWRLVGAVQWLAALAALVGLVWLAVRYALFALGLPLLNGPMVGRVPLATVLLGGGLLAGALIATVVRPLVRLAAKRVRARAENRLRAAVTEVARELVVAPVRGVLHAYADARAALDAAR
jgi:GTP-binding protein EngB required for normal cell division